MRDEEERVVNSTSYAETRVAMLIIFFGRYISSHVCVCTSSMLQGYSMMMTIRLIIVLFFFFSFRIRMKVELAYLL